ncbi:MAG TPA: D-alanyl-D-alanine carboxypeptidase/D-alanyl-D-alanine-endopeptidase, partial [Nocardioides sp.]|uniref:D-alanyl-D-alanine carboxypeptidase/D-alanyl-D-alanine endopeptidase n=1 Tax=Nocardioides sp. TaxID=35761 RepID=UPI002B896E9D
PAVYAAGRSPLVPASTTKLLTATAALEELGPDHVFTTRVVAAPRTDRIVLVGGGDPYLSAGSAEDDAPPGADLATLARRTAAALTAQGIRAVRLGYDATLFSGPTAAPSWEADYLPDDVVSPITALWVDEGRAPDGFHRVADPPAYAAAVFARALTRQGVAVRGSPVPTKAPGAAPTLASVESAPLAEAVERVLEVSDNEGAEVLAHHVGLATGHPGSFAGGVAGVEQALGGLGVPLEGARLFDGSGLSRANRLEPATLLGVLRVAAADDRPELRSVLTGLPVAGFTGSLAERFTSDALPGRGLVRAKTGTLTGVSGLAGLATGRDGTTMVFVLVADRIDPVDTLDARAALDGLAAALARCRCGG